MTMRCHVLSDLARRSMLALTCAVALGAAVPSSASAMQIGVQEIQTAWQDTPARQAAQDRAKADGASILRVMMPWREVAAGCDGSGNLADPNHPCYNWARFDAVVADATARNLGVLISIWQFPEWANGSSDPLYTGADWSAFQSLADRQGAFTQAAAARYATGSPHGTVGMWTIGNEPGSNDFWHPDTGDRVKRFAYLYLKSAQGVRAGNPAAKVAPGPTGPKSLPVLPIDFVNQFNTEFAALGGTASLLDGWAHNPYAGANFSPMVQFLLAPRVGIGNMNDLFAALDAGAITHGLHVWGCEFAYQTPPDPAGASFAEQSVWMGQAFDVAESSGRFDVFFWYVMNDPPAGALDWESGFYDEHDAPKPSRAMFQRPISLAPSTAAVGGQLRAWGRSNVNPLTQTLVQRHGTGGAWSAIPGQGPTGGGGLAGMITPTDDLDIAVQDATGIGPVLHVANNDSYINIVGGNGNDTQKGGNGDDVMEGGAGNDTMNGGNGDDDMDGGSGNDKMIGGDGDDDMDGGTGNDNVAGGNGNDDLDGGKGNDKVDGGAGNDKLEGGEGNDQLRGGAGNDTIDSTEGALSLAKKAKKVKKVKVCEKVWVKGKKKRQLRCKMRIKLQYKDKVFCGAGKDSVKADWNDVVAKDCEKVTRVN